MSALTLKAVDENLDAVLRFIDGELDAAGCPGSVRARIDIAVSELFTNIAHYAYGAAPGDVSVNIGIAGSPAAATITFTDWGAPFNPLEAKAPDTTLPLNQREEGGLGIHIVKNMMDDIGYEYVDGKNILSIVKGMGI